MSSTTSPFLAGSVLTLCHLERWKQYKENFHILLTHLLFCLYLGPCISLFPRVNWLCTYLRPATISALDFTLSHAQGPHCHSCSFSFLDHQSSLPSGSFSWVYSLLSSHLKNNIKQSQLCILLRISTFPLFCICYNKTPKNSCLYHCLFWSYSNQTFHSNTSPEQFLSRSSVTSTLLCLRDSFRPHLM